MGEDPGGHSHLAGRAGRHLERRHAGGKDLGTSRIASPLKAHGFRSGWSSHRPTLLAHHHTEAPPSFLSHLSRLPPTHTGPSSAPRASAPSALPPPLWVGVRSPWTHWALLGAGAKGIFPSPSLLQGWQSRSLMAPCRGSSFFRHTLLLRPGVPAKGAQANRETEAALILPLLSWPKCHPRRNGRPQSHGRTPLPSGNLLCLGADSHGAGKAAVLPYRMLQGRFCGRAGWGHRTARIASSKTVFRPRWVRAEHSRYFTESGWGAGGQQEGRSRGQGGPWAETSPGPHTVQAVGSGNHRPAPPLPRAWNRELDLKRRGQDPQGQVWSFLRHGFPRRPARQDLPNVI